MTRTYNDVSAKIRETIVEHMPKDAEITRIEFEGPRLAIYVRNVNLLSEQSYVVTEIVNLLHKRIVIRSDQSIRLPEREAEGYIRKLIPTEAEVTGINFDPSLGEVVGQRDEVAAQNPPCTTVTLEDYRKHTPHTTHRERGEKPDSP